MLKDKLFISELGIIYLKFRITLNFVIFEKKAPLSARQTF